jgi:hypothetical protein
MVDGGEFAKALRDVAEFKNCFGHGLSGALTKRS